MIKIDCFGDFCPIPILKIQKQLKKIDSGTTFMVTTDHSCVLESINEFLKTHKISFTYEEIINGVWEITITKL
jgi:TusA-related sulfurtransferase